MGGINVDAFSASCPEGYLYNFGTQNCEPYHVFGTPMPTNGWTNGWVNNSSNPAQSNQDGKKEIGLVFALMTLVVLVTLGVVQLVKASKNQK